MFTISHPILMGFLGPKIIDLLLLLTRLLPLLYPFDNRLVPVHMSCINVCCVSLVVNCMMANFACFNFTKLQMNCIYLAKQILLNKYN